MDRSVGEGSGPMVHCTFTGRLIHLLGQGGHVQHALSFFAALSPCSHLLLMVSV